MSREKVKQERYENQRKENTRTEAVGADGTSSVRYALAPSTDVSKRKMGQEVYSSVRPEMIHFID